MLGFVSEPTIFRRGGWSRRWLFLARVAVYHSRILRARDLSLRAVAFYERGLARIEDRWDDSGETGERFDDPHHVYASDLDLFGKSSLFQLLSTARTRMGEETLAQWLLAPATVERIRERQAAVTELRNQLDLREDLAVLGGDAAVGVHPEDLVRWAESPNVMSGAMDSMGCSVPRCARDSGSGYLGLVGYGNAARSHHRCRGNPDIHAKKTDRRGAAWNGACVPRAGSAFRRAGADGSSYISSATTARIAERTLIKRSTELNGHRATANARRADQLTT